MKAKNHQKPHVSISMDKRPKIKKFQIKRRNIVFRKGSSKIKKIKVKFLGDNLQKMKKKFFTYEFT